MNTSLIFNGYFQGETSVKAYFPMARWYDFRTVSILFSFTSKNIVKLKVNF